MEEVTAKSNPQTPPIPLPLKTRFALWTLTAITNAARRRDGTINRRLLNLFNIKVPANPKPIKGVRTYDVTVDPTRDLWFRVFDPTQHARMDLPVIVFFHGGGFTMLSPDSKYYDLVCRRFAAQIPAVIVSVNYRLSPEHCYPAQYDDGFDVLKFLDGDTGDRKVLPENADISACFLAGDSAGGNLAHHVGKRASESEFRKLKAWTILRYILLK